MPTDDISQRYLEKAIAEINDLGREIAREAGADRAPVLGSGHTQADIFLLKYGVGVELSMRPGLRLDPLFALSMAAGYGALTGLFSARPVALWLMAGRRA